MPRILTVDVETAPNIGYIWGMFKQNLGLNMLIETSYLLSYSAKWLDSGQVLYEENRDGTNDKKLARSLRRLLDKADIVIAHNAKKFDIPVIQGRMVFHKLAPPSPFKVVDTLLVARKEFRFISNKLEHLADLLGCAPKLQHGNFPGFELWSECLKGNDAAWQEMKVYNIQDVLTLEQVYLRLRPWMRQHPNLGVLMEEDVPVCPKCGSKHIHFRGYVTTNVSKFHRFQCKDCGGWGRTRYNELGKEKRKALVANVA